MAKKTTTKTAKRKPKKESSNLLTIVALILGIAGLTMGIYSFISIPEIPEEKDDDKDKEEPEGLLDTWYTYADDNTQITTTSWDWIDNLNTTIVITDSESVSLYICVRACMYISDSSYFFYVVIQIDGVDTAPVGAIKNTEHVMQSISTLTDNISPGTHEISVKARVSNAAATGQFGYGVSGHPSLLIQSMIL